jgi:flagellar protein FlgJ
MASGKGMGLADMLVRQLGGLHGGGGATQTGQGATQAGSGTTAAGNSDWQPKSAQEFVDAVRPHAEKAAAELGVPARALIAQAALETGWGQHIGKAGDGSSGFNLFGIKAQSGWSGPSLSQATAEFQDGQWTTGQANFRSYGSIGAAFDDYVKFLKDNPRYADAIRSGNVQSFADGLQKAGYATDPQYAQKLLRVANSAQMAGAYNASAATA